MTPPLRRREVDTASKRLPECGFSFRASKSQHDLLKTIHLNSCLFISLLNEDVGVQDPKHASKVGTVDLVDAGPMSTVTAFVERLLPPICAAAAASAWRMATAAIRRVRPCQGRPSCREWGDNGGSNFVS